jgi:hypothetical protein
MARHKSLSLIAARRRRRALLRSGLERRGRRHPHDGPCARNQHPGHRHRDSFSQMNNCIATGTLESLGIMLAGGLVGAMVGSASPSWKPRYP